MRYSIMLQLVSFLTLLLVGGAALFAWVQSRPDLVKQSVEPEEFLLERP
jgi:hypothetical protein